MAGAEDHLPQRTGTLPMFILSGPLKARSWKAVDVTSIVEEAGGGEDYVSFALTTRSQNAV
jgi:hypothetical protein